MAWASRTRLHEAGLVARFFGLMMVLVPFPIGMPVWNMAYAALSVLAGFLLVMVS